MNEFEYKLEVELRQGRASLAKKMAKVIGGLRAVPKTGSNSYHGYTYHTEDDIVSALRPLLSENGIGSALSYETIKEETVGDGRKMVHRVRVRASITLTCSDTGFERVLTGEGEGEDGGDKATYKALTGAYKYILMKTFLLSDGESDPERSTSTGERTNGGGGGNSNQRRAPEKSRKPESKGKPAPTLPEVERELTKYVGQAEAEKFLTLTATNTKVSSVQEIKPATLGWVMGQLEELDKIERGAWIMEKIEAGA